MAELTFDAQGGVLECVGTVQDISDLRRSESVLRESEARLEMVLAASGLGCWDADVTTGKLTMDARIGEMLGYSVDELAHLDFWSQLIDPRDRERFKHDLKAHLHGDSEDFRSEHRLLHKNGHWVFVEARGRLIERGAAGTSLRMAGVLMDITQRKRLHDEGVDLLKQIEALIRENVPSRATTKSDARILDGLTRRELQILGMIAQGLSSPEIARQLNLALNTVGTHRQNLMSKLDLHTAVDVTRFAIDHGLLKKS